jgi:hypothetical protein
MKTKALRPAQLMANFSALVKIISLSKTKQKIQLDGIRKNATSAVLCCAL